MENNISVSTLKYWITRLNKEQAKTSNAPEFVPIQVEKIETKASSSATIRFGKISIEISDGCQSATIKTIIDVLNSYV